MTAPVLVFALGTEAAAIGARAKGLWDIFNAEASVLAIGPERVAGLVADVDVAPLERDGQDLPRAAIATALAGFDPHPDVFIVADLADHEAAFCVRLALEARRVIGSGRRLSAILILPVVSAPALERSAAGDILGMLWPTPGESRLLDRLYLVEDAAESGTPADRERVREAVALRLAIEGDRGAAGDAIRARSDAITGAVRSLGGVALRYPGRAVAELAGARLGAALVEGWCGGSVDAGGPLPGALPVDEDALEYAGLTPESTAELEAFLDELLWSLRARYPKIAAVAGVLPAELALLEDVHFGSEGPDDDGEIPVLVRASAQDVARSVLEPARERLQQQVVRWRSRVEWELVDRCRPAFLEGGGLARGLAFLEALHGAIERMDGTLADRRGLAEDRQAKARERLDGALVDLGASARKVFFRNEAAAASLAACRRAAVLYLTTRAERVLLGDFRKAIADVLKTVGDLRERLSRLTAVLTYVQHGLEDRARAIAAAWRADNLLDPGDPETAYRDAVGPLPDEEALLASVHEDFVAGGSVLDLPIGTGDEQHLIERLQERAILRFPALLESTFGQGLAQRLANASARAERLTAALEAATPLLRLLADPDGALPGRTGVVLAHESGPPEALLAALTRLGFPDDDCTVLPRKLADHLVIWTERGEFAPDSVAAIESLPGSWPPRSATLVDAPVTLLLSAPAEPDPPEVQDAGLEQRIAEAEDPVAASIREAEDLILASLPDESPAFDDLDDGVLAELLREEDRARLAEPPEAPEPDAPQPDAPQPDAPQPDAPKPGAPAQDRPTMVEDLDDGLLAQMLAEEGLT